MPPIDSRIPLMVNPVPVPDLLGMQQQRQQMAARQMSMQDLLQQREEHAAEQRKQRALEEALAGAFDEKGVLDYDKAVKAALSVNAPDVAMQIQRMKPKAKEPRVELKVGANGEYIGVPVKEGATGVKVPPKPEPTLTPYQKEMLKLAKEREHRLATTGTTTKADKKKRFQDIAAYRKKRLGLLDEELKHYVMDTDVLGRPLQLPDKKGIAKPFEDKKGQQRSVRPPNAGERAELRNAAKRDIDQFIAEYDAAKPEAAPEVDDLDALIQGAADELK